jgi:Zn-dependent protease with chaperone function
MPTIVAALILLAAGGCFSYTISEVGVTETSAVDYAAKGAEVMRMADERAAIRARHLEALPGDHPMVSRVRHVLDEILATLPSKATIGDRFWDKQDPFEYFHRDRVQLVLVPSDIPVAEVYPNGIVYITTGLVDPEFKYAARSRSELVGMVGHELTHLYRGHVLRQWVLLEARQREVFKRLAAGLTVLLPGVSYTYSPGATYEDAAVYDRLIEYEADVGALEILERLGLARREYGTFLDRLAEYVRQRHGNPTTRGWIEQRATCLRQWFTLDEAAVEITRTVGDRSETSTVKLTAEERFSLCATAHVHLSPPSAAAIAGWLAAPTDQPLVAVLSSLPAEELPALRPWVSAVVWKVR